MWANIKLYAGISIAAIIGVLYAAFRVQKAEKESAVEQKDKYKSAAESSEKAIEVKNDIEEAGSIANAAGNDELDSMLNKYDRNRKN
jgi:Flp pilus assembly protein TadB